MDRRPLVYQRRVPLRRSQSRESGVRGRAWYSRGRRQNRTFVHPTMPRSLSRTLSGKQLKVIDITKTPFAVSNRTLIYCDPELRSNIRLRGVSGEERRPHIESRILFDEGNSYLHWKVLPGDLRCGLRHCRNRDWPGLGHCIPTTSRIRGQRSWWPRNWGEQVQFPRPGCS